MCSASLGTAVCDSGYAANTSLTVGTHNPPGYIVHYVIKVVSY